MSKKKHTERRQQARQLLTRLWPALFDFNAPKPLKIGILEDMLASVKAQNIPLELADIRFCLRTYTLRSRYQKCLIQGGERFNLNGEPCGVITPEQQTMAKQTLNNMHQKMKRKQPPTTPASEA